MACWPSGDTTQSAKACARSFFTWGNFAGFNVGFYEDCFVKQLDLRAGAWRQRRQYAVTGFDHADLQILVGIDAVEAIGHHFARRAVQLRSEIDLSGAGADDRDFQLLGTKRRCLRMCPDTGIEHAGVKAPRVGLRFQHIAFCLTPGVPKSLLWLPTS
jgi:hypothetical protein